MGKSSRAIKKSRSLKNKPIKPSQSDEYSKYSKYTNLNNSSSPNSKSLDNFGTHKRGFTKYVLVGFTLLILVLYGFAGGFSSDNDLTRGQNNQEPVVVITDSSGTPQTVSAVLYSSTTCDCCNIYTDYANEGGFEVFQKRTNEYQDIKREKMIPESLWACHTTVYGKYFAEGHIPLDIVVKMLNEQPDIDGIALAGMPGGSPGMELMDPVKSETWNVMMVKDGVSIGIFVSV